MADPLTAVPAMISAVESGFRTIDGLLLRKLYLLAGDSATAAGIEAGYRMVDADLLRKLAMRASATQLARQFVPPGPRLIDGLAWKSLAIYVNSGAGAGGAPLVTEEGFALVTEEGAPLVAEGPTTVPGQITGEEGQQIVTEDTGAPIVVEGSARATPEEKEPQS